MEEQPGPDEGGLLEESAEVMTARARKLSPIKPADLPPFYRGYVVVT